MKKSDKFLIKIFPICLIIVFFVIPNFASASWMKGKIEAINGAGVIDSNINQQTDKVMDTGITVAKTIGKGLATIMLIVIGIKYLLASPEGRAEYKKTLPPYIAGAILVFFVDTIVGWFGDGAGSISDFGDKVNNEASSMMDSGKNIATTIGQGLATIMLIVIGIKYLLASPEGRAEYRKTLTPYIAGAILVYSASTIVKWFGTDEQSNASITEFAKNAENNVKLFKDPALNIVTMIGTAIASIMLIVIGIKYMTESPEGKADYKKSMIPYVIGAILVFSASTIVGWFGTDGQSNASITGFATNVQNNVPSFMGSIITAAKYIGVGVAILMLLVLAIKYMTASPEGKVEIQKTASVYIVGAVILFAASAILAIIQSVSGNASGAVQPIIWR